MIISRPKGSVAQPWVRVLVRPRSISATVVFDGSVWVYALAGTAKGMSLRFRHGSEQIQGQI